MPARSARFPAAVRLRHTYASECLSQQTGILEALDVGTCSHRGVRGSYCLSMRPGDVTSRAAVLQAVEEYDALGRDVFLAKYGFGKTTGSLFLSPGAGRHPNSPMQVPRRSDERVARRLNQGPLLRSRCGGRLRPGAGSCGVLALSRTPARQAARSYQGPHGCRRRVPFRDRNSSRPQNASPEPPPDRSVGPPGTQMRSDRPSSARIAGEPTPLGCALQGMRGASCQAARER